MAYNYYLAIFETKNKTMFLYSVLEALGYKDFQVISAPCAIRAGCNYGIKFNNIIYKDILFRKAEELNIGTFEIYMIEKINGQNIYRKIS